MPALPAGSDQRPSATLTAAVFAETHIPRSSHPVRRRFPTPDGEFPMRLKYHFWRCLAAREPDRISVRLTRPGQMILCTAAPAGWRFLYPRGLTFCGVHDIGKKTLYLTKGLSTILTDGQAPFAARAIPSMVDEICAKINQRVEEIIANDRSNLPTQIVSSGQAKRDLQYYQDYQSGTDSQQASFQF